MPGQILAQILTSPRAFHGKPLILRQSKTADHLRRGNHFHAFIYAFSRQILLCFCYRPCTSQILKARVVPGKGTMIPVSLLEYFLWREKGGTKEVVVIYHDTFLNRDNKVRKALIEKIFKNTGAVDIVINNQSFVS